MQNTDTPDASTTLALTFIILLLFGLFFFKKKKRHKKQWYNGLPRLFERQEGGKGIKCWLNIRNDVL